MMEKRSFWGQEIIFGEKKSPAKRGGGPTPSLGKKKSKKERIKFWGELPNFFFAVPGKKISLT